MIKILFNRNKKLNKEGKGLISFSITLNGNRKYISSEFYVFPKDWDEKKCEVRKSDPNYLKINRALKDTKSKWENREIELRSTGDFFTIENIVSEEKNYANFIDFCQKEAKKRYEIGDNGYSQYSYYRNVIDELIKFQGVNIPFKAVNLKFINDFREHLLRKRKDLSDATKSKYLRALKTLTNACADDKIIEPIATRRIKNIKAVSKPRENLTFTQLKQLETIDFVDKNLDYYRDLFLTGCYTGLRFSDLINLKKENIIYNPDDGGTYLRIQEKKTKKWKANIPLHRLFNGKVLKIFAKYESKFRETIFPDLVTDQCVNRNLKIIHQIMKFDVSNLTFHLSRHTFGTLMAELDIAPYLVQQYMMHSDIKTTMKYIHTSRMNQNKMLEKIVFPD